MYLKKIHKKFCKTYLIRLFDYAIMTILLEVYRKKIVSTVRDINVPELSIQHAV